jgi:hypothetical protein
MTGMITANRLWHAASHEFYWPTGSEDTASHTLEVETGYEVSLTDDGEKWTEHHRLVRAWRYVEAVGSVPCSDEEVDAIAAIEGFEQWVADAYNREMEAQADYAADHGWDR